MSKAIENFNFLKLGQAIQKAREQKRITREELSEELGISARHLQSIEKEGQYPSFPLFIQLVTMFHISVDQYIHPEAPAKKSTLRRQLDALFDTFDDSELTIIAGTAQGICKAKDPRNKPLVFSCHFFNIPQRHSHKRNHCPYCNFFLQLYPRCFPLWYSQPHSSRSPQSPHGQLSHHSPNQKILYPPLPGHSLRPGTAHGN